MKLKFSVSEARRIALTSQGFNGIGRQQANNPARLRSAVNRLGLLQIDSVNVLARAHYLPLFSRLGPYDCTLLDNIAVARPKRFFEYWGHEASLLPIDCQPLLRWRMDRALRGIGVWKQLAPFARERRASAQAMIDRITADGPLAASDIASKQGAKGMWDWSETKLALEWLFWAGLVCATHRRGNFERVYDLPDRVLPHDVLHHPTPTGIDARRALLARAARSLGVATADDLRDYFRIPANDVQQPLRQLVEDGTIIPVTVQTWKQPAYLHKDARAGRRLDGAILLSPFDPLVWYRPRTERLFGFRYRLEIYTPAHKREYGYYVLPFLLDGVLVARVDLKADRKRAALLVLRVHLEPGAPPHTIEKLGEELRRMATWLGLADLIVAPGAESYPSALHPLLGSLASA